MNTMKALQATDGYSPVGNLSSYMHWIHRVPVLSLEEEQQLAMRLRDQGDLAAARQLVMAHLRFVAKIARSYAGYGLAEGDLIQEGNIGLMKAVKRFDPSAGVRLVSFAVHWIKAEMHEFIIKNWRIVKIATTKAQRKLFFNLRSMKKRLGWATRKEIDDIAKTLNVKPSDILHMEQRLNASDMGFDGDVEDHDDNSPSSLAPSQYLGDHDSNPATIFETNSTHQNSQKRLSQALQQLDVRSQGIIEQRWLREKKATLHDLAATYKISAERVRQLEQQAMQKLKSGLAEPI